VKARIVAPYTLTTNQFLTISVQRPAQPQKTQVFAI
jgi:hypothetical protein